jgi:hypothetical protein
MTKEKCNHHDFDPENIYLIDNKFKISNHKELDYSGYGIASEKKKFRFLSPELLKEYSKKTP